ncbi:Aspartic protease 3 [Leucoagaricus sp. SymC.cos]|nr:Aspartic protease 3 [Leucoagaricus sp. SymC.cos]
MTLLIYGGRTHETKLHGIRGRHHAPRGIHLPVVSSRWGTDLEKRGATGLAGLGDYLDISYSVLVDIDGIVASVLIDTGSSDLWVLGDSCITGCDASVPLHPLSTVNSTGLDVSLRYGDSGTGTYAYGVIGNGIVDIASLQVSNQKFALINRTNAGVKESSSSGIFGLGFPVNSVLWNTLFVERYLKSSSVVQGAPTNCLTRRRTFGDGEYLPHPNLPFRQSQFPDLSFLDPDLAHTSHQSTRAVESLSDRVFQSYLDIAPLLGRLIAAKEIDPMFAVSLQRDTVEIGGNAGQLSIGELPPGTQNDSLTWVPVRGYTRSQGGLPPPADSPGEVYPIAWEIPIDDVYLDGTKLPRSNLSSSTISVSALIDTGNSLIRGPEDVITEIDHRIGTSFLCSDVHTLAFSIGGKLFPVDPRDFVFQQFADSVTRCIANVVVTDPPAEGGYLFSWSLGTPFLKGVISAFYFGDLQYPSRDPPRVGLLSTVPQDAGEKLTDAVNIAKAGGGNFPSIAESASTGTSTRAPIALDTKVPVPTRDNPPVDQGQGSSAIKTHGSDSFLYWIVQGMVIWILY